VVIEIRDIRPDDYERVGQLTLRAYDTTKVIHGEYRDWLADPAERVDECTAVWVAELDGEVVGTLTYVRPGDGEWEHQPGVGDCGFRVLAVDPAAEGTGVGAALVDHVIERARGDGCHRMVITSMEFMKRAHGIYERRGFVRRPDLDVRFHSGVGLIYTLDLTDEVAGRFSPPGPVPDEPPWFDDVEHERDLL
jgi:GNAT superfamily N-acetyltransferase